MFQVLVEAALITLFASSAFAGEADGDNGGRCGREVF